MDDLAASLDAALLDLGVEPTSGSRELLRVLATDSVALHRTIRRLAELRTQDASVLLDVDALVTSRMQDAYPQCTEPSLLRKGKPIGPQTRLLLSVLLERLSEAVPLQELLLITVFTTTRPADFAS